MSLNNKSLDSLTETDLQSLLDNAVPEGKTIDYKRDPLGNSDSEKKNFLCDISAFANASGGHLIFGIDEAEGLPTDICGLELSDIDAEVLKLDNIIRDGISPRIPGTAIQPIPLHNQRVAIVIKIPKSWASPHMVIFKGASKFYSRNSAGNYQLDVGEIRAAFLLSETSTERIQNFRRDRLSKIVAQETPVNLLGKAQLVLHIIPMGAFDLASQFDVSSLYDNFPSTLSTPSGNTNRRLNFDGLVSFDFMPDGGSYSYVQTFRNGIIEAVDTSQLMPYEKIGLIDRSYEYTILQGLSEFLKIQQSLGVEPPFLSMLSFLGVKGYRILWQNATRPSGPSIDRDAILTSEVLIEDFDTDLTDLAQSMKPAFNTVWNAAGLKRSLNYDETGVWISRRST